MSPLDAREVPVHDVATLQAELRQARRRLATHEAAARILAENAAFSQLVPNLLGALGRELASDLVALWMPEGDALACAHVWRAPGAPDAASLTDARRFARGEGLPGRAWASGRVEWAGDSARGEDTSRAADAAKVGLLGAFAVPLRSRAGVLGVLEVFVRDARAPDADLASFLDALGLQLGAHLLREETPEARGSDEGYRSLVEASAQVVWSTPPDGRLADAPRWRAFTGQTEDQARGHGWLDAVHAEDRQFATDAWRAAMGAGAPLAIECRLRRADGAYRHMIVRSVPVASPGGGIREWVGTCTDVTERKDAEQRVASLLVEAERQRERLDAILRSVRGVVWEASAGLDAGQKRIDFVSDHVTQMLGYTREEWLSTPNLWLDLVHPEDRERAGAMARGGPDSDVGVTAEFRWRRKDGSYVWVEARTSAVRGADGRVVGMRGVMLDVSQRKRAERAAADGDERFHLIAQATNDTIWDWDLGTNALWWNENFSRTFGHASHEIEPDLTSWTRRIHPEDLDRVKAGIHAAIEGGGSTWEDQYRFIRADGTWAEILDRGLIVRDASGRARRMVGSMMDLTPRKAAEAELDRVRRRLAQILEFAGEGIYGVDATGVTTFMNAAALKATGLTLEEAVGHRLHDVIHHTHPDGSRYHAPDCPIYKAAHGGPVAHVARELFFHKDGTGFPVEYVTVPIVEGGRTVGAVTVFKDVTERLRTEAVLDQERALFAAILEQLPAGALVAEAPSGRLVTANKEVNRILRHEFRPVDGVSQYAQYDVFAPDGTRPDPEDYPMARALRGEVVTGEELVYVAGDGARVTLHVNAAPVRGTSGEVVAAVTTFIDITDRKRAEAQVREWRERLDVALRAAEMGAWDLDLATDRSVRSPRHDQIFGYDAPQAEWGTERFLGHVLPEHRAIVKEAFDEALRTGRVSFECQIRRADGAIHWIAAQGLVSYDAGRPVRMLGVVADTTEKRRAVAALREKEERLRAAMDASATGTFRWDLGTNALQWDDNLDRLFGLPPGRSARHLDQFTSMVHPDDRPLVADALGRSVREGADFDLEFRVVWPDGSIHWLLDRGSMIRDKAGRPLYMTGACTDITARKRTEEELRQQGQILAWQRHVLEDIATGAPLAQTLDVLCREAEAQSTDRRFSILLVDADGRRLRHGAAPGLPDHYNAAVDGIAVAEGVGSCGTAAHRQRAVVVADIATDPLWRDFKALALPIGLRACWSTPILGSNGRLLGTLAIYAQTPGEPAGTDEQLMAVATRLAAVAIERARSEEELRYQRDLTRTITDNAASALFMMDTRGTPIFVNPAALAMTGYASLQEINDKPLHDSVHFRKADGSPYPMDECPIDRANSTVVALKDQREVFTRKDGSLFPVEYNVAPVTKNGAPIGAVVEVRDITQQLHAEAQLRARAEELARLAEALERSNRELDHFAYVTSHDLKAPLRGIANLSRWIEEDLGEGMSPAAKDHLDLLRGRAHRMEALIDAILEYSRVGRQKQRPETVDVGRLLSDAVDLLSPPPTFRVEIAGNMPQIVTERTRLQQVFMNLIGNAIKHHDRPDGVVRIGVEDAGSRWRFVVSDDGPGIAPRFHEKIFVIFQTLQARDKVEGTGVGLALVKKIVESHGGAVAIESDEGRGATFRFTWPKSPQEAKP